MSLTFDKKPEYLVSWQRSEFLGSYFRISMWKKYSNIEKKPFKHLEPAN